MKITERKIDEIKPYAKNAKKHPKKQIEQIAASIKAFGFNQPIVVDEEDVVIVGHGRLDAARLLQLDKVPTIKVGISEEAAKAYRLSDNKLNESDWEMELVIEELKGLSQEMIELTGFDDDLTLNTLEDDPFLPSDEPQSKVGDMFEIGAHRLLCGDSTLPETYEKLFANERARMIFTDPPYGVDYVPSNGLKYDSNKYGENDGRIFNDDKDSDGTLAFFNKVLPNLTNFSTDDATLYWWYASSLQHINHEALTQNHWHISQTCIWLKNSLIYSPGQNFHRIYEPCMVAWKEGKPRYKDVNFASYSELWEVERRNFSDHLDVWYQQRDKTSKYIHPTQKPVALAERALKRSSEKNDIILDAFNGSGSTMMACQQLNRRCYAIELDPKYIDAAVKRMLQSNPTIQFKVNGIETNHLHWTT